MSTTEHQAVMHVTVSNKLALFEVTGHATRDSVIDGLSAVIKLTPRPDVVAAIAMYDQADLELTLWDWMAIYQACESSGLPANIPVAIVVSDDAFEQVRSYCAKQAGSGVLRAVFTDRQAAMVWVTEMAGLIAAQHAASPRSVASVAA
jgi:hypothetical protein